ncbi:hypothetical protein [Xanthomonas bundabergensis]|uniref:hypothetical protein n=1 Tax=Xanthomonas bundabergensis TaxID=3160842 RepID=UPI0035162E91
MSPRRFLFAAALCAALPVLSARAGTCTSNVNVVASSLSDIDNRDAGGKGGHVGLHMQDATTPLPPSGADSQKGKSAFADWNAFKGAFTKWAAAGGTHANCGTSGGAKDIADAASVGITQGWTCTAAAANGVCTAWQAFVPVKVCFWYANSPGKTGTAGKWLISTAYPSLNADCT